MKKNLIFTLTGLLMASLFFVTSCTKEYDPPVVSLSQELIEANAGEEISVSVSVTSEADLEKVVVTSKHDGEDFGTPKEFTDSEFTFTYTVSEEDVDPILSFNFTATDVEGNTGSKELVVDVALTMTQLLLKYNWLLSQEIRDKTGENDISDVYTDDVYRFNEDGTYNKSIGEKVDDFSDIWFNYCYWNLDEEAAMLIMTRTGAFGEDVRDTINMVNIDHTEMTGQVVYYGLDVFDPENYDPVENYTKGFSAVAKGADFDPYLNGPEDDATGPAGFCNDIVW